MNTIICPVDFSDTSINAAYHAYIIAEQTGAVLEFLHQSSEDSIRFNERLKSEMERMGYLIDKNGSAEFGFTLVKNSLIDYINQSDREKAVGLVVIGTNGVSNLVEFYEGTNTQKIAGSLDYSVLVIPATFTAKTFNRLLFMTDYEDSSIPDIDSLLFFTNLFNSQLEILHISAEENSISKGKYDEFVQEVKSKSGNHSKISFKRIISTDKEVSVMEEWINKDADLVVMHKKSFSPNDGSKTDLLTRMAVFPLLILR